jgi:putative membrane protein
VTTALGPLVVMAGLRGGAFMPAPWMMGRGMLASGFPARWVWGLSTGLHSIVFLALVLGGVLLLVRLHSGAPSRVVQETPLDILKRRYASGEATREQYEKWRQDFER